MVNSSVTLHDQECVEIIESARDRFLAKVGLATVEGCTDWQGKRDKRGYGVLCVLPISKYVKAHRMSWVLANGPIPIDKPEIMHLCDRPSCVNPLYLACGTHFDNIQDAVNKGRNSAGKGEGHRNAKLTEEKVRTIRCRREGGESCVALGREFGVGRDQISRICNRKSWAEIA